MVFDVEKMIQAIFIDGSDHLFVSRCIAQPEDGLSKRSLNPSGTQIKINLSPSGTRDVFEFPLVLLGEVGKRLDAMIV